MRSIAAIFAIIDGGVAMVLASTKNNPQWGTPTRYSDPEYGEKWNMNMRSGGSGNQSIVLFSLVLVV